ncbi:adenylate/guanylate cyclase [Candidatus Vecturithrix granuli]|uniref:Adenylate/guanylate cyclase n=1 Tax=Vecturithrix granuli TaxID=1499967 RepID=A0A081C8N2_VECG1|nr:adenylate/guanylate cyclase [Candidatus Vecturithrix granuli]
MISSTEYTSIYKIHESANSLIYRGTRTTDQHPVILKTLNREYPSPQEISRFKREYEITRSLQKVDGVIRVYGIELWQNSLMMVLEDIGGQPLNEILLIRKFNLEEFLQLAIRMSTIVGAIHQQHIMHKDLNPSNFLWNPETDRLRLIDFGIAAPFSFEQPEIVNPAVIEGTLAYISPEQTGRMNRIVDYRTDFYALGVTFYELLLGFLPFQTNDTMELIHAHLAKHPRSPNELNHLIPRAVSEIVMKLLAKTATERYQHADRLITDLQKCLEQLQHTGAIQYVAIGQDERSRPFEIPQKLYGRAKELDTLLTVFHRSRQGRGELFLASGYSGIGKTALVYEFQKTIIEHHGYFIAGKFEQFKQNMAYSAVIQALQSLLRQLLTENESRLALWREKLAAAVGNNTLVLSEFLPEVEMILGTTRTEEENSPEEAQNRLHFLLQDLIQALSAPEHPLVIFLDNLQWADMASLQLVQHLLIRQQIKALLIIGAYRDDDAAAISGLNDLVNTVQKTQTKVTHIALAPLAFQDVAQLLVDSLHHAPEKLEPFARLMLEKTAGNPFAIREFLKTVDAEGLLSYDSRSGCWQWNLEQIQGLAMPENMAAFMTMKIRKLPAHIQQTLQCAACIGNRFDLSTLAAVMNRSEHETVSDIDVAIQEGVIFPADESYRYIMFFPASELKDFAPYVLYDFVHHRFQEAALDLISSETGRKFHLKIGQYLLHQPSSLKTREEHLTAIVDHLNLGAEYLETEEERRELVQLNLSAGRQAKAAPNYTVARQYFTEGVALLEKECWRTQYELTFELVKEQADIENLIGNFTQAEQLVRALLEHAQTINDRIAAYKILILHYTRRGKYAEALHEGENALTILGMEWPGENMANRVEAELSEVQHLFSLKSPAALLQTPLLTDSHQNLIMQILHVLIFPACFSNFLMYAILIARMMKISLTFGHTPESVSGYAHYGVLLGTYYGKYQTGYDLGIFAIQLSEQINNLAQRSEAALTLAGELTCWVKHLKFAHMYEHEAYHTAIDAGEVHIAGLALMHRLLNLFCEGTNLEQIRQDFPQFLEFVQHSHNLAAIDVMMGCQLILENLTGFTSETLSFDTDALSEAQFLQQCQEHQNRMALSVYQIMKLQLLYLYGHPQEALHQAREIEPLLDLVQSFIVRAAYNFYVSLSVTALYPAASAEQQQHYWTILTQNQRQMQEWAEHCPENFQHCYLLVQAEMARLTGQRFEAIQLYHQAIEAVQVQQFPHHKALTWEIAARFYQKQGLPEFAELYIKDAYHAYTLWGAKRKMTDLLQSYPYLSAKFSVTPAGKATPLNSTSISTQIDHEGLSLLDLNTTMKASQAISENLVLTDLLKQMMRIVIESAGAQKGWLIRKKEDEWLIDAEGNAESKEVKVLHGIPLESVGSMKPSFLPTSIIHYVIRTKEPVLLQDAAREGHFTHDPYITQHQVKSVLCTPLIKRGKISGVIYLENDLATGVFTPSRLKVLNVLSAQMVISIENAALYKQLRESLNQQIDLSKKQVELTNGYSRFIPKEFLSLLGKKSIVEVQLGDQIEKEISVMFSDIRGFTPISEQMTPQENFNFINSYLSRMSPIIQEHRGFIDKYIGDGIMALFPTNADDAVRCSLAMLKTLKEYNQGRKRAGYLPIQIGIGLNTGSLMLGTVGDQHRMDGTVISDAVNLAARIEDMTKTYGASLLIGETTYFQLKNPSEYSIRIIDQVQAKGKSEPVTVFEVFDADPPQIIESKLKTLVLFKQGFKLYHRTKFAAAQKLFTEVLDISPEDQIKQIAEAKELFNEILHVNPHDKVARIYYQRCQQIEKYGVSEEWSGVWDWINALKKGNDILKK